MTRTLIRGGRVLDPAAGRDETADVLLDDGKVAAGGPGLALLPSASVLLVVTRSAMAGVWNGIATACGIVAGDLVFIATGSCVASPACWYTSTDSAKAGMKLMTASSVASRSTTPTR